MSHPAETPRTLAGACLCGAATYDVADAFHYAMNCHCSNCRRRTGSAFKPIGGIPREHLHLTAGPQAVQIQGGDAGHDVQCATCGSLLYSVVREGAYVHVAMGTLVDTPTIRPSMHIFVASKAEWYVITDGLPQFDELPGEAHSKAPV